MEDSLVKYVLPEPLSTHFKVERVDNRVPEGAEFTEQTSLYIYLTEKNRLRGVENPDEWEAKDFTKPKTIQDFPLRGRKVYWVIKFRRWRHEHEKGRIIQNNYAFLADGTRLSAKLSAFLKSAYSDL